MPPLATDPGAGGAHPGRRAGRFAGRFAPVSAAPAGFLRFAVWYFRLSAALLCLPLVAGLVNLARVPGAATRWVLAAGVGVLLVLVAFYLGVASLLERRRPLGVYLTVAVVALSLVDTARRGGGVLDYVIPALSLLVAAGAWRELRRGAPADAL